MNRRQSLKLIGGGMILAATALGGGWATTRNPERALKPWQDAGQTDDPRRFALSYAILAPNPHNRQPWLVDFIGNDTITLFADPDRMLPMTDPFQRQITIGLGCFLELLRMAAAEAGYGCETDVFPDGEDPKTIDGKPVARVKLTADDSVTEDPLFSEVLTRRSNKEPFDTSRIVSSKALEDIARVTGDGVVSGFTNDPKRVDRLRRLTHDALVVEVETPHTFKESVDLFRIGRKEIEANPDGIDFSGPMFEGLAMAGLFTRESALDPTSSGYAQGKAAVLENADTAMAHGWIVTKNNNRVDQLNAGRDWLRMNLVASKLGLGTQPLSQALQEFQEMAGLYKEVHEMLAPEGGTVQMLARFGYGKAIPPSPRWPYESRLLKT
ncbi:MAG: twin-arginine translocation pathway signal protein [Pseudomonadota bacterium]